MSSRPGDLDPGILVHLLGLGMTQDEIQTLFASQSGLVGLSGSTGDMRVLLEREGDDPRAAAAVEVFCYQARKFIGAFAAALGGIDALVFTGGIGEHAPAVRARITRELAFLGVRLDEEANARGEAVISARDATVTVRVIHSDEDRMIARHTRDVIARMAR